MSNNGGFSNFTSPHDYFAWYLGGNNNGSQDQSGILQIQMDIVGFLAILGEGSVLSNAQVASLSWLIYLPRLMPAPQALLRTSRPDKLESHSGYTTSVHGGNVRHHINHVGHVLVDAERWPQYSVRCVRIQRRYRTMSGKLFTEDKRKLPTDESEGGTLNLLPDKHPSTHEFSMTAKTWGPLGLVAVVGCCFSIIILVLAAWRKDGFAFLADIILSMLSSVVGYSQKWQLDLQKRAARGKYTPPGDVVIRYLKGSFLVVSCDEDVARQLYIAPENVNYNVKNQWQYRVISLVGTIMLMFGVIFLANSSTWMQLCFAGAYIIMNALYWIVAALPQRVHWDTSCFKVSDQAIEIRPGIQDAPTHPTFKRSNGKNDTVEEPPQIFPAQRPEKAGGRTTKFVDLNSTFTWAIWKAILVTQSIDWVLASDAAPKSEAWRNWLDEALAQAAQVKPDTTYRYTFDGESEPTLVYKLPDWNAQKALQDCMERTKKDVERGDPETNRQRNIQKIEQEVMLQEQDEKEKLNP